MHKFFQKWNSVHSKLLRTILISFMIGVVVTGATLFFIVKKASHNALKDNLNVAGGFVVRNLVATSAMGNAAIASDILSSALDSKYIEYICLYDDNLQIFSTSSDTNNICTNRIQRASNMGLIYDGDTTAFVLPVIRPVTHLVKNSESHSSFQQDVSVLGFLYIKAHASAYYELHWLVIFLLLLTLASSFIVVYFLGGRVVWRLLVPLDALYKTSTIIAKNPLSEVRAEKISDDEVGRVVDVFNAMLDNLAGENKALTHSENRFRTLAENAPIGVFLRSKSGEYEYSNSRWCAITGLNFTNASDFFSFISEDDKRHYQRTIARTFLSNQAQVIEYNYMNPERGERILMEYLSPVTDDDNFPCFIGSLLDVTELKVAQRELEKLAFYDPLTQLSNRRFFRDHLDNAITQAAENRECLAMYMTDLDEFKKVNDSLGHDVGDQLLVNIAQRLSDTLTEGEVVSRMGGDEFMVLASNVSSSEQLKDIAQRILKALNTKVSAGGQVIQVSGSVGVSLFPNDASTSDELIRYADIALYDAKEAGGHCVSYYSHKLDEKIKAKVRIEQKLRQALADEKLDVFIQPQYASTSRKLCWGEALVRWYDDEDGFIPPNVFIPMAEDAGLICDIGDFVFERVLQWWSEKAEDLSALGIYGISVNLSAKQFFSSNFSTSVAEKFREYNVEPSLVEFELTETAVMDDIEKAVVVMESLRELGCHLSIDDFGTGYSSLSYLKRFPITRLKIDKSFIKDIPRDQNDIEISCAIIAMAHNLGLTVVAEGVETELQASILASYKCEYLQGYFFNKPMPLDTLLAQATVLNQSKDNKIEGPLNSESTGVA